MEFNEVNCKGRVIGMTFTCNDIPRCALGFYNPNHAAALICALVPFCWGWRGGGKGVSRDAMRREDMAP